MYLTGVINGAYTRRPTPWFAESPTMLLINHWKRRKNHDWWRKNEARIPIREEVKGACEILGLDPLYVGNEGKLLAIVAACDADRVLAAMQSHPLGREAAIIGEATSDHPSFVMMKTRVGGTCVVDMLSGEQLPRIC